MTTTPAVIKAACFAILETDSAGSAVRAALGSGAASVVAKDELSSGTLPACPFVALQWGPEGGPRTGVRSFFPTWWVYDDVGRGFYRINAILPLIEAAYPATAIAYCYLDFINKTGEIRDQNLGLLPCRGFPFIIKARG